MRDLAQLREDIAVMGTRFGYLDNFILKRYGAAVQPYYCHLCGKCEATCPKGVAISTINRCLMYEEAYRALFSPGPLTMRSRRPYPPLCAWIVRTVWQDASQT